MRALHKVPALLAWLVLMLPWQVCESDCQTAIVGILWSHSCHVPAAHGECTSHHGHGKHDLSGCGGPCGGGSDLGEGEHQRLQLPAVEPGPPEVTYDLGQPQTFGDVELTVPLAAPAGGSRWCSRPPGPPGNRQVLLRSVVLLL